MDTEPYGEEAFNAFTQAMRFVKEGKYDEARKVNLILSDSRLAFADLHHQQHGRGNVHVR